MWRLLGPSLFCDREWVIPIEILVILQANNMFFYLVQGNFQRMSRAIFGSTTLGDRKKGFQQNEKL